MPKFEQVRDRLQSKGMPKHEAETEAARICKARMEQKPSGQGAPGKKENALEKGGKETPHSKGSSKQEKNSTKKSEKHAPLNKGGTTKTGEKNTASGKQKELLMDAASKIHDGPLASSPGYPLAGHEMTFPPDKNLPKGKKGKQNNSLGEEGQGDPDDEGNDMSTGKGK